MSTIDIRDLEILLEDADDFQAEANKYFEPQYTEDGGISLRLKPGIVLAAPPAVLDGRPSPYALGSVVSWIKDWLIERERKNRRKKYLKKKDRLGVTRIVAEGDSWFQHPLIKDIIDWVEDRDEYAVLALARAGDELRQMVNPGEYLQVVKSEQPRYFLLSAGGNDFLGDIRPLLKLPQNPGSLDPVDYLSPRFPQLLEQLRQWLEQIFVTVLALPQPPERILVHGYDYAIPCEAGSQRDGEWLGTRMRKMGIHSHAIQTSIVRHMIDAYTSQLATLAADARWNGRVRLVDYRGSLPTVLDWYDEIHPTGTRNRELAEALTAAWRVP